MTAKDYFLSIKRMADELALAGQPLKSDEILTYILAGLGQEYDSLVSTITSRSDAVTLKELYSLLLIAESRINQHHDTIQVAASVNMATRQPPLFQSRPGNIYPSSNRGRGSSYRGKGRGDCSTTRDQRAYNSLICQVCLKPGHHALKCYHRFDLSYQDQSQQRPPHAFLAARHHHAAHEWHLDTGATHHLTNDLNNIHLQNEDYDGYDHIQVANGAGLKITQSGTSTLSSPSKLFVLNQILLVPELKKIFFQSTISVKIITFSLSFMPFFFL